MLKTFYVGNLEWKATEEELKNFFSSYGEVTSVQIKRFPNGLSRGFAFVTMENADQAMQELNGKEFRGRNLKLNEAREREKREYNPRAFDYKPNYFKPSFNYREPELSYANHYSHKREYRARGSYRKDFTRERQELRRDYHF